MDDNIQKLQQIGIKEISKQTRISNSRLKDIFEHNFSNFRRVHLVGFLQILEREYKLDLSSILKAYDDFHENGGIQVSYGHNDNNTESKQAQTKHQTTTKTNSLIDSNKSAQSQPSTISVDSNDAFNTKESKQYPKEESPKESSPKEQEAKKARQEIPQIDLRLDIDEPQKPANTKDIKEPKPELTPLTKESKPTKSKKTIQNDLSLDTQKRRYDAIDERKKQAISKQRFYLTVVCAIIAVLIYLIYQNLYSQKQAQQGDDYGFVAEDITVQQTQMQESTQDFSQDSRQSNEAQESSETEQTQDSSKEINESNTQSELPNEANTQNLQSLQPTQQPIQAAPQIAGKMVLKAENMLWFDIVDLDTNRRKYQGVTSDTYSIDKDDNHKWLLAFGHSNFSLSMNGVAVEVPRLDVPLYFIYEPASGFKRIDNVTYKRLSDQAR